MSDPSTASPSASPSVNASDIARSLRAIPSEKRSAVSRENGRKGGRPRKELSDIPCNCGVGESMDGHKAACLRGQAIKRRR